MPKNFTEKRPTATADTECFPNYWNIEFRCVETGRTRLFEQCDEFGIELDRNGIAKVCRNWRLVTFNGIYYDMPMLTLAMSGVSNEELKRANDEIILTNLKPWEFFDRYGLKLPDFIDHIDLMPVAPAAAQELSLKGYAGRMHAKRMIDLPFDPDYRIRREDLPVIRKYVGNDTSVTAELFDELSEQCKLRAFMSQKYGIDVRSKSDAQVAEAVIKREVEQRNGGRKIYKPEIEPGFFSYVAPRYIQYQTPELQHMLSTILRAKFRIRRDGYVDCPELKALDVMIGGKPYRMGLGGLHSQEESISHYSDDEYTLRDRDVTGYYPNLIIASKRYPKNMGSHFQTVFKDIVETRTKEKARSKALKKAGDKAGADVAADNAESMKIMTNGTFGKTGSPFSVLYSPDLLIYTTLTGQLSILMLIEQCSSRGWEVISANTDGFVTRVPNSDTDRFNALCAEWEWESGLETEETVYRSVHSRDVNSYLALTEDDTEKDGIKIKRKGEYAESGRGVKASYGLKKNPNMDVCNDAVMEFLKHGTPVETTIRNCQDIRKFVVVQRASGGGYKDGEFIGKWMRYYYADDTPGPIFRKDGARVGSSEGACPCMELPDELPDNIDYERYEREAYAILHDIGVPVDDPDHRGRSGFSYARLPDQKNIHWIDLSTGVAACGMRKKALRDPWVELPAVPEGHRFCSRCRKTNEL
jgi:hypothetical protein